MLSDPYPIFPFRDGAFLVKSWNKLGLYWAKLSSNWDWALLQLNSIKLMNKSSYWLNWLQPTTQNYQLPSTTHNLQSTQADTSHPKTSPASIYYLMMSWCHMLWRYKSWRHIWWRHNNPSCRSEWSNYKLDRLDKENLGQTNWQYDKLTD